MIANRVAALGVFAWRLEKMQMHNSFEVYARLYDVVSDNLIKNGKCSNYKKTTFLYNIMEHPREIDVSRYLKLSNEDFLEAIYVAALKRLPDDRTRGFWAERFDLPTPQFQQEVLKSIADSSVVAINGIHLKNNPYFEQKCGLKYKALGRLYYLTDKSILRELGKKLPASIQKIIRKVFL